MAYVDADAGRHDCYGFNRLVASTAGKAIQWIALVPRDSIGDTDVRTLVEDYFFAFHRLPVDPTRLSATLAAAYGMAEIIAERARPRATGAVTTFDGQALVAATPCMRELLRQAARAAKSEAPVVLTGETGTGKELLARLIHGKSRRRHGPFVPVNCGALPAGLIQSELFGHEKGAFTGALRQHMGKVERAEGGTLLPRRGVRPLAEQPGQPPALSPGENH